MTGRTVINRFAAGLAVGSIALLLSAGQAALAAPVNCEIKISCLDPSDYETLSMARSECRKDARGDPTVLGQFPDEYSTGVLLSTALVDMGAGPPLDSSCPVVILPTCFSIEQSHHSCIGINQQ